MGGTQGKRQAREDAMEEWEDLKDMATSIIFLYLVNNTF